LLDNQFRMDQISPRVFEATAMGCALIMVRGDYSGILAPGVHYLPVDTDFGNIGEIVDCIHDTKLLASVADRAHYDLISSGLYSYKAFAYTVRENLEKQLTKPMTTVEIQLAPLYVDMSADPRNELPSLKPMSVDTFQLKFLLSEVKHDYFRVVLHLASKSLYQNSVIKALLYVNIIRRIARIVYRLVSRL